MTSKGEASENGHAPHLPQEDGQPGENGDAETKGKTEENGHAPHLPQEDGQSGENEDAPHLPQEDGQSGENGDAPHLPQEDGQSHKNGDTVKEDEHVKNGNQPRNIGGRRGTKGMPQNRSENQSFGPRPELICRENYSSQIWEIFLPIDEEHPIKRIYLEDGHQTQELDITDQGEYHVPSLRGCLVVTYEEGKEHSIPLFKNEPLIFQLPKNWKGKGRKVSRVPSKYFIAIAPDTEEWKRVNDEPPVEQGNCTDPGFQVHFFNATVPSEKPDGLGKWRAIPSSAPIIKLQGQQVFDDSEEGDLFVDDFPALTLEMSREITWVRVGEEARYGWKGANFKPNDKSISEILGGKKGKGRFFVRVYDEDVQLIDSLDFRYLHNLIQIRVNNEEYTEETVIAPTLSGYPLTEIRFVGIDGKTIIPRLSNNSICKVMKSGIIEIPPNTKVDRVDCVIDSTGGEVNIALDMQVWWRMEFDNAEPGEWHDKPIVMTQREFQQYAREKVRICLSSERFAPVRVGFGENPKREYRKPEISLDDFADYREVADNLETAVYFNVTWSTKLLSIVRICANPPVEPKKEKVSVKPNKKPHFKRKRVSRRKSDSDFVARVKRAQRARNTRCKWRNGRGFSCREVEAAGLKWGEATFIMRDSRRRSLHPTNVEKIQEALDVHQK